MYTNEKGEKLFTLEEIKDSTFLANKARYKLTGCIYLALLDLVGKEMADKVIQEGYYRYGHLKHEGKEIIPNDVKRICEIYAPGEFPYFPAAPEDIPYEVLSEDKAVIRWCMDMPGDKRPGCVIYWEECGMTREQAIDMCHNASYGDIGYADKCGLDGYMTKWACQQDCDCCEFVVERRK